MQNFEMKQLKKGGTWTQSVNTKEINWFPLQKVNFARRKLEGANPATITRYFQIVVCFMGFTLILRSSY